MHIIELTELQYRNYSRYHSNRNYKQSIEYANLKKNNEYKPLYLGLIDDNNNVHAATLILEKKMNGKYKYGYSPNGYLINYNNLELLKTFTIELKNYLKKLNYIYIRLNPNYNYQVYNGEFILKENNSNIIEEFKKLGYSFLNNTSKYKMIIQSKNIEETFKNFKRSLKRNIKDSLRKGITIYQGTENNIEDFLLLLENKERYRHLIHIFNNPNNKFEFYLAKLTPETYINNYRFLLKKEQINNEKLNQKLKDPHVKKSNKLIEEKMTSDKTLSNYNNEIIKGTEIYKKYPKGTIIAGIGIISNKKAVSFIKECYNNEFKDIRCVPMMKWEVMKKYISQGCKIFDMGKVTITNNQVTKAGYNGDIIEYTNDFDLVINDMLYKLNGFSKKILKK